MSALGADREIRLLASSGTLEGIVKMINEFYCSTHFVVDEKTLAISNLKTGKASDSVRVVKKGRRYRFEML